MSIRTTFYLLLAASLILVTAWREASAASDPSVATPTSEPSPATSEEAAEDASDPRKDQSTGQASGAGAPAEGPIDLFAARDAGLVGVKFIAKSDARGRILLENKTAEPVEIRIPEAFVGRPILAQFGGGGGGGGLGGQGGGGLGGGGGGGQSVGGGGGGLGGGGGGFGGGGGGQFSIPPDDVVKVDVPLLCLDHGKRIPSSSKPYELVPADEHLADHPEVIELLAAFGSGGLDRGAAQAAAWRLNSGVSWEELAAKLDGTERSPVRNPYFSRAQLEAGVAYAQEASRRAAARRADRQRAASDDESMAGEDGARRHGPEAYAD